MSNRIVLKKNFAYYYRAISIIIWELFSIGVLCYIAYNAFKSPNLYKFPLEVSFFVMIWFGGFVLFPLYKALFFFPKFIEKIDNKYKIQTFLFSVIINNTDVKRLPSCNAFFIIKIKKTLGGIIYRECDFIYPERINAEKFWCPVRCPF